ncbi:hypothetical protein EJD97_002625 [Solanum chilense]|uniref:Uncharacterized protein n=1 Tax=Solanum chilense TaxID=4083 RepID=A0A6N2C334_SOLCI|nr:hypothetical protein EJD97_002625 [Solanum chilense]
MRRSGLSVRPMILKLEAQLFENHPVSHNLHHDALSTPPSLTELEEIPLERTTPASQNMRRDALSTPTWLPELEARHP